MKSKIVRIGNSRGIRIPKPLMEQAGLEGDVEIQVEGNRLIIGPANRPRVGWDESFKEMTRNGDDLLLQGEANVPTEWEEVEWEW